ncbi:MAG: major facilitator superfamily domain-containing protein [Monoraphidium minutum]|nr:MAG: major facilitator superfamily domain-containing protein [Monoraphidium minutum]
MGGASADGGAVGGEREPLLTPAADGSAGGGGDAAIGSCADDGASLVTVLWRTGVWRLLLVLLVYSTGFSTLLPVTPTIFTNFFASRAAGAAVDCETTPELVACLDAHAQVVRWSSVTSFVSNSLVSFAFSPLVGDASDARGRKPFLLASLLLALLPAAAVLAHLALPRPGDVLLLYYPATVVSGVVSSIVVCLSYCADKLPPRHRTAGFGLIIAAFSLGFVLGPGAGAALAPAAAAGVAFATNAACAVAVALAVPESLPPSAAARGRQQPAVRARPLSAVLSMGRSWALINSRPFFRRLALCVAILGVVQGGVGELIVQYLQLTLGFTTRDQGALFVVLGGCNLVVQIVLLPLLVPALGEKRLLVLGLVVSVIEQALLAVAAAKWQALAAIALGSFAGVSFPAVSAIKSNHCGADEQGLVQGALAGIRAFASGLGPLLFSALFAACATTGGALAGRPGLVFWVAAALTAAALAVAITVDVPARPGDGGGSLAGAAAGGDVRVDCGGDAPAGAAVFLAVGEEDGGPTGGRDALGGPDQEQRPPPPAKA